MRNKTITLYERDLMFVVAGQLYDQAPDRNPRKADIIMKKVKEAFRSDPMCFNDNEFRTIRIEECNVYNFVHNLLMNIPEYVELNLSQIEFDNNVKVDDPDRLQYKFVSRYDVNDSESWKSDFIDLDAFIRNVVNELFTRQLKHDDCFLCIHQSPDSKSTLDPGESDICKLCSVNPNLKYRYECSRQPKGKYTFSCNFDCYKSRYICCEECYDRYDCEYKCDSSSDKCGQAINHVNKPS